MSDMIMTDIPKWLSGWPERLAWWGNYPFNLYDGRVKHPSEISGEYQHNHSYMPCMHTCTCTYKTSKKKEKEKTIHEVWITVYLLIVMHLGRGADHPKNLLCKWVLFVTSIWKLFCSLFLRNLNGFVTWMFEKNAASVRYVCGRSGSVCKVLVMIVPSPWNVSKRVLFGFQI